MNLRTKNLLNKRYFFCHCSNLFKKQKPKVEPKKELQEKQPVKAKKETPETPKKKEVKDKKKEEETTSKRKLKLEKKKKRTEDDDFLDREFSKLNPTAQQPEEQEEIKPKQEKKQEKKVQPKKEEIEEENDNIESLDDENEDFDVLEKQQTSVDLTKVLLTSGMIVGAVFGILFALAGSKRLINFVGKYAYALSPLFSFVLALVGGFGSRSSVRAGEGPDQIEIQSYGIIALFSIFVFTLFGLAKVLAPYFAVTKPVKIYSPKASAKEPAKSGFARTVREIHQKKVNYTGDDDEDTASVDSEELSD
jgi:hypothetical protein